MGIETVFNLGDRVRRKSSPFTHEWMIGIIDEIEVTVRLPPFPKKLVSYHIRCDDKIKSKGFHCWYGGSEIELVTEATKKEGE